MITGLRAGLTKFVETVRVTNVYQLCAHIGEVCAAEYEKHADHSDRCRQYAEACCRCLSRIRSLATP